MAQVSALVSQFASRRTGDIAVATDAMRLQLRSGQDATQAAFGELTARREAATADLQVGSYSLEGRTRECSVLVQQSWAEATAACRSCRCAQLGFEASALRWHVRSACKKTFSQVSRSPDCFLNLAEIEGDNFARDSIAASSDSS